MHSVNYLHRDISCGNVFLVSRENEGEFGVLADLEYAIDLTAPRPAYWHVARTGTAQFIASEVERHEYYFITMSEQWDEWQDKVLALNFQYNALHDVESMWWLCVWCITAFHLVDSNVSQSHKDFIADRLFPIGKGSFDARASVLMTGELGRAKYLPLQDAVGALSQWGKKIYKAYQKAMEFGIINKPFLEQVSTDHLNHFEHDIVTLTDIDDTKVHYLL
ncbi:hypothetical protein DL93DRAFT_724380 [Clavulina sp. PMI_390]|nr:hypothetical protein DL93DRAFT_724380 [Clavulina sp. PMI_390]